MEFYEPVAYLIAMLLLIIVLMKPDGMSEVRDRKGFAKIGQWR